MAEEVKLPELGESITEGIVTSWLVSVGDTVDVDQPIVEISTDKVDTEIPSPVAGVVQELRADVDDTIEVGQVIAIIGEGDVAPPADDGAEPESEEAAAEESEPEPESESKPEAKPIPAASQPAADGPREPAPATPKPAASGITRSDQHTHDVVVLGGGTGGYSTALRAAQLGLSVALVERDKVGGTCLHYGCIPTKALLQSAEVAEHAQQAADFGVNLTYEGVEIVKVNEHKQSVVDKMYKGLQGALKGRGVETFVGTGRLTANDTIEVTTDDGTQDLSAPAIVVATGSVPRELPFAPFDGTKVISSDHALELDTLPSSAIVLGSGAVGMEFASAWHAFGVEVTVVELLDRLLPLEDADSSKEIARAFRKQGITTMTSTKLTAVDASGNGVVCTVENGNGDQDKLEADLLLVAVGRGPVSEGAGLEEVGVSLDRGFVVVDEYCRTSVDGIWALGDVIETLGLAHASFAEGFLVADQLGGLDVVPIDYAGVPRVTFSHPEVASVGLTEEQAKARGEVVVEKFPMQALGRAAMAMASGMVKIVAEADESAPGGAGRILGIHIVGPRATDLIAEAELIYNWEALPTDVAQFIHAHPSFGEAIGEAHLALAGRALHG